MNSNLLKRLLAMILAIAITAIIFTGCGKSGSDNSVDVTKTGETDSLTTDEADFISVEKYVADYVSLPAETAQIINTCIYDNQVYFAAYVYESEKEQVDEAIEGTGEEYSIKLYKLNSDGTGLTELSGYTAPESPEGKEGSLYISVMNIDENGNIWTVESNNSGAGGDSTILLRKLDLTGAELYRADISDLAENKAFVYITGIQFDGSGSIYLSDMSTGVYAYDNQGKQLYALETPSQPSYTGALIKTIENGIAAHIVGSNGYIVKQINTDSKSWGADISLNLASGAYSGSGDYDFYYNDGSNLFGYSLEEGEGTKLLTWHDCYVNGENLDSVEVLPDGTIFATSYKIEGESVTAELAIITIQTVTEATDKKILELAVFGVDPGIRTAVAEFNKENEQYKIEVTDYLQMGSAEDLTSGLTKLHTEIITGNIPDMICTMGALTLDRYISKGLLEDLYPYIDNDDNLSGRDAFVPEVLGALETDDALYQIAPGFIVYTVIGKSEVVGNRTGWTFDEMIQLLEQHPKITQIIPNATADNALTFLAMNMDDYVNWQTGECSFTDESFLKFLEFANSFPKKTPDPAYAEDNYQMIKDGRALLDTAMLTSFLSYQMYNAYYGGDISFIGYPCDSGSGSAFYLTSGISISSICEHKDAAWEFISSLLTEEYQTGDDMWQFPTNKAAFEKQIQDAMKKETTVDENGEIVELAIGSALVDGQIIEIFAATQEDVDQIKELIGSIDKVMVIDSETMSIITEEAQAYFNGQKSAEDTAAIIQQRISTFVNEQR